MFFNYLKVALRNLQKQKFYTSINIFGLTLGITCCLLIFLYVQHERNFDHFHERGNRIYRLVRIAFMNGELGQVAFTSGAFARALTVDFPEDVEAAVRLFPFNALVSHGNKAFKEDYIFSADADFFRVFSFPLLAGNPAKALAEPYAVVLTQTTARKYFGRENPLGQILTLNKTDLYKVTGVMADVPSNSHLQFDLLTSNQHQQKEEWMHNWRSNGMYTYVLLPAANRYQTLETKLPAFMEKHMGDLFQKWGMKIDVKLQPLHDIYLRNRRIEDEVAHGSQTNVYIFSVIAVFILLIACINFMNLASARSTDRAKEVGMRKVLGAYKQNLIWQFLGESILLALVAGIFSILLMVYTLPFFNAFTEKDLVVPFSKPQFYFFLLLVIVGVGLGAGSYPAFFLSSFRPVKVLKGKFSRGSGNPGLRRALVVFQFSVSIILIIGTVIIFRQMHFVQHKKLGFTKEQVITLKLDNPDIVRNQSSFIQRVKQLPEVENVSVMSGEPGGYHNRYVLYIDEKPNETWSFRTVFTDTAYLPTLDIKLMTGRNFSGAYPSDVANAIILNETAVKQLGWTPTQAIGKCISDKGFGSKTEHQRKVIGIVQDYHFCSLKEDIEPLAILMHPDPRLLAIRLQPGNPNQALGKLKQLYAQMAPKYPFVYTFLDESFAQLYKTEQKQAVLFSVFSVLAILIACLGLFGLASYTTDQRRKEIGIRKILGASTGGIITLLSRDFLKLVLLANIFAWPLAWYVMNKWLEAFSYRVNMEIVVFLLVAVLALFISFLTISFQAVRVAMANPVHALREE
jgi:putative ABC transport system permease protein